MSVLSSLVRVGRRVTDAIPIQGVRASVEEALALEEYPAHTHE